MRLAFIFALGSLGCGANVVFVDDSGSGAGGHAAGAGGAGAENGCGGAVGELREVCFQTPDGLCPPSSSSVTANKVAAEVSVLTCHEGPCCAFFVQAIPCGPRLENDGEDCCYTADLVTVTGC